MEEVLQIRLTLSQKNQLKEMANEKGITVTELIFKALKIKRRVRKPASIERNNFIHEAA